MNRNDLLELLRKVSAGDLGPDSALEALVDFPSACLGYARIDTQRQVRRGIPETVYGEGKTPGQIEGIVEKMAESGSPVLVTRISGEAAGKALGRWPAAAYDALSRTFVLGSLPGQDGSPVMVMAAGTSDLPVAEEAARTISFLGREVIRAYDVGVSGLHRLASFRKEMERAGVIVAVAGMEGALPSVVAGLVSVPVIGVPTSIGYGASFGGITPLLTMLSSCACGLTVVNIDNGYGAAVAAHFILGARDSR
ncbi:MAG: nickel pincer cofactor biosynthesis protein LarB [Deltaproteobacteria bacterium]|nr:nickel pincer cofactor biosynthesis protein LarB [Deltaproteobacteria bacterium]